MEYFKNGKSGWWMPSGEKHLLEWMNNINIQRHGRKTYQSRKYDRVLSLCKKRLHAVDIGGHVGLWSWQMAHDFRHVTAFEPMPEHAECWIKNMSEFPDCALVRCALGDEIGSVVIRTRTVGSSGDTGVEPTRPDNGLVVPCKTLDSFDFTGDPIDLIKIDCEGFELFVLKGARETLLKHKPALIVEQKPETGMEDRYNIGTIDAVAFLQDLGAKLRDGIQGDYFFSWD